MKPAFQMDPGTPDSGLLAELEAKVYAMLRGDRSVKLRTLGQGEISVAVAYPTATPRWACKRLPPFADRAQAECYRAHIQRYMAMLRDAGVGVVPTEVHLVPSERGRTALYLTQAVFSPDDLAVTKLRQRTPDAADEILCAIFDQVMHATGPRLALDAQLANWVWHDGRALQFDISTPFTNDAFGRPELDLKVIVQPYPAVVRPVMRRWVAPGVIAKYHDPRGVLLDFAGNLIKERLAHWLPAVLQAANQRLDKPITQAEVEANYRDDARLWEVVYRLKRLNRWWYRTVRRDVYPFLLASPTAR
jgi:hypothetical protein